MLLYAVNMGGRELVRLMCNAFGSIHCDLPTTRMNLTTKVCLRMSICSGI